MEIVRYYQGRRWTILKDSKGTLVIAYPRNRVYRYPGYTQVKTWRYRKHGK